MELINNNSLKMLLLGKETGTDEEFSTGLKSQLEVANTKLGGRSIGMVQQFFSGALPHFAMGGPQKVRGN